MDIVSTCVQNCPGCQYRVDGIFIWNDASWDIQAIYPESTTGEGSYKCAPPCIPYALPGARGMDLHAQHLGA